jgi:hypothetical protein
MLDFVFAWLSGGLVNIGHNSIRVVGFAAATSALRALLALPRFVVSVTVDMTGHWWRFQTGCKKTPLNRDHDA